MNTLPIEIVRDIIMPFTYQPIPNELKEDILSFHKTIANIKRNYALLWTDIGCENYMAWISNDISRYLNNDHPLMYGYNAFYKKVFRRLYMNKDKKMLDVCMPSLVGDEHFQDIKTSVGLLTPTERDILEKFLGAN